MAPKLATAHDIKTATASYGPAALKAMGLAFDQAWEEIAGYFEPGGQQSQIMRLRLAKALLEVATDKPAGSGSFAIAVCTEDLSL